MKRGAWHGALSFVCAMLATSAQAQSAPAAQREIEPLLVQQTEAANAHDTDRFLTSYLHDSTFVLVFNDQVIHGFTAVRDQQLEWWNNGKSDVVYSERAPSEFTVVTPTVVLVTQQMSSKRTLPSGETRGGDFVATSVWQRRSEGWRVVEAHESTGH
jgi:ketosteroid isomerase-like protein